MTEACVEWAGAVNDWGYGTTSIKGRKLYAHRVAYANANGMSIDDLAGLVIRHRCDNPLCVNPKHLVIGTHDDNMKDMTAKGRSQRGDKHYAAKLTEADIPAIKMRHAAGESVVSLAKAFSVGWSTISRVIRGVSWRHVGTTKMEKNHG